MLKIKKLNGACHFCSLPTVLVFVKNVDRFKLYLISQQSKRVYYTHMESLLMHCPLYLFLYTLNKSLNDLF